jgi:hypothetical protein
MVCSHKKTAVTYTDKPWRPRFPSEQLLTPVKLYYNELATLCQTVFLTIYVMAEWEHVLTQAGWPAHIGTKRRSPERDKYAMMIMF